MAGKYQVYPEYKAADIGWAHSIPGHWARANLRWLSQLYAGGTPSKIIEEYWQDGTIPWLSSGEVNQRKINEPSTYITVEAFKNSSAKWIPKGALVMALAGQGKTKGIVAYLKIDTTCNQSMAAIVPYRISDSRYLFWWLDANYQNIRNLAGGDLRDGLNLELIGNIECPIPSEKEKEQIANFLDHETAKIDTLIEKQQQLIKLLKEKRQAVISHAVTKGLNPNAPMRDSGVEWLGEVPAHWVACLIKYKCSEITDGAHISPVTEGGERYFVSIRDINKGVIDFENALLTTSKSFEYLVKTGCVPFEGDILFSKDGTIGQTAITPDNADFVVASSLIIIRPNRLQVTPQYLDYLLRSEVIKEQVESFVKGAALRRLSIQNLLKVWGVFPPVNEQQEITSHLANKLQRYDVLELKASELVDFLKERRTALISAAVTGKIDVRDWKAPEQSQANQEVVA